MTFNSCVIFWRVKWCKRVNTQWLNRLAVDLICSQNFSHESVASVALWLHRQTDQVCDTTPECMTAQSYIDVNHRTTVSFGGCVHTMNWMPTNAWLTQHLRQMPIISTDSSDLKQADNERQLSARELSNCFTTEPMMNDMQFTTSKQE